MRLLNTTSIEVERFTGNVPQYAILSHRWDQDEIELKDMQAGGDTKGMEGYRKLRISCAMAARDGFRYIWIDTCCIDKSSSAELSEAINSMFRYYKEAEVCYVYLSDVASTTTPSYLDAQECDFCASIWFTRGWTLQELIAPKVLRFYNKEWDYLGTKAELKAAIRHITNIPENILLGGDLTDQPISRKMSWVSSRQTTVPEDIAYCLLGVFGVNIPLLYGEGEENAFLRLQEAILKSSDDNSIFLWRSTEEETIQQPFWGLLAKSPTYFSMSPDIDAPCTIAMATTTPASLTGRGVHVEFLIAILPYDGSESIYAALIYTNDGKRAYGLMLQNLSYSGGQFARVGADILLEIGIDLRVNYSKLPRRISSDEERNHYLNEPQALRFYVRQNPKPLTLAIEAIGFYFDPDKSLPPELSVDDWSLGWNRWEGGRFSSSGPTYLLEYDVDKYLGMQSSQTNSSLWNHEIFGVLQLSDDNGSNSPIVLCVGLQQTSSNFLNTPLNYCRPWGLVSRLLYSESPDKVLKDFCSPNSDHVELLRRKQAFNNSKFTRGNYQSTRYTASFEPQIRYGRVYYLIRVTRDLDRSLDTSDVLAEGGRG